MPGKIFSHLDLNLFQNTCQQKAAALTQLGKIDCFQFLESTSLKHRSRRKAYDSIPMSLV